MRSTKCYARPRFGVAGSRKIAILPILKAVGAQPPPFPSLTNREFPMKVVSSIGALKYRHPDCQVVKRRGRIYVICKSNPKFKVRQGGAKVKKARR